MRQRDRESVADSDTYSLFDDPDGRHSDAHDDADEAHDDAHDVRHDDDGAHRGDGSSGSFFDAYDSAEDDDGGRLPRVERVSRSEARRHQAHAARRRGNRRFFMILALLLVVVVGVSAWLIVLPIYRYLHPDDYSGQGTGNVVVTVHADDSAQQIGTTLYGRHVVASVRAFTNAASDNSRSTNIQAGSYRMHRHMAAANAVTRLLDPAARVKGDVLVREGATVVDVRKQLTLPACKSDATADTQCGPGLTDAQVRKALADVKSLGLPQDYLDNGKAPQSVEGFLYPATYSFTTKSTAAAALQQMISKFADEARATDFTSRARALGITPYRELVIASLAEAEAKFPEDYPKVARVILNRLTAKKPLQIDASTRYGALLDGKNPSKVVYSNYNTPYNTYLNDGLPPTPIGNPGSQAMTGVGHPAAGNWLYYVNGDAQGHLVFLRTAGEFEKARQKCHDNNWGCA